MNSVGTLDKPLRVAVIGSGPAGFYAAEALFKAADLVVGVDVFDQLPTPHGLVRAGVAPDHQKIKNVIAKFEKTADHDGFRFFGNVEIGKDITVAELREYYHQIVYCTGAQVDRRLGIPGEDLARSHSATEFVAWYNGHPDYVDHEFDLSQSAVAIVGVGNVAVDVARILCRTIEELETTDIADYALDALRESRVRDVYMLGRRGPAQAAFSNPEAKELGELPGADVVVLPDEAALDPISRANLDASPDRLVQKKVDMIQAFAAKPSTGKEKRLHIRFLVSPTELLGSDGAVTGMRIVHNELVEVDGRIRPRATDRTELLDVGLVFRSVGYRGVEIPGVPFNDSWGVVYQEAGRVLTEDGKSVPGEYAAGWIKRGPTGVIGTNKADAQETVATMIEDVAAGRVLDPGHVDPDAITGLLATRQPDYFSLEDWRAVDAAETARGATCGRPRVKMVTREEMIACKAGRK